MAQRIQRKRTRGWRMPAGAVYVGRPTKWGNPFWGNHAPEAIVQFFRDWLERRPHLVESVQQELRGKDLACWCPVISHGAYVHCHADVLLSLANDIPIDEVISENTRRAKGEAL